MREMLRPVDQAYERVAPGWRPQIVVAAAQMAARTSAVRDQDVVDSLQLIGADADAQLDGASVFALSFDRPNGPREYITRRQGALLTTAIETTAPADAKEQFIRDRDRHRSMEGRGMRIAKRYAPFRIATEWRRLLGDLAAAS
ncbi:hypothetical protein [Nonomuraea insulae]|uniref:Uncharacterized protein n=1 Tax=Nonomuraea insulae TaxID=1616787 RepID=A0ABW1CKP9_9ACTN